MKLRAREHGLIEAVVICERCSQDIAPIKTFEYIDDELHYAKCVFGTLGRLELAEAQQLPPTSPDRDFIDLYLEEYDNLRALLRQKSKQVVKPNSGGETAVRDYAFAKCRSGHVVGLIIDKRHYITAVSPVRLMFPSAHYESWDSRWWANGYPEIVKLQKNTLRLRKQACESMMSAGGAGSVSLI